MHSMVAAHLLKKLQQRELLDNKRQLRIPAKGIDFFSNDYLGIATTNILREQLHHTASYGATGSRLLSGNYTAVEELETFLADFHQTEAALVFNSGYDANLGLFACIADRHSIILYDEYCHASIIDGIRLSQAKYSFRFRHNDLADLEEKLKKHAPGGPVFIAVESVYSMEGDLAPLSEIAALASLYNAALIVDEAHATGVFGENGAGLVQQLHLQENVFARVHTFGKAMGCHGAVVVGSCLLKEYLVNFARSFIYTTALPEQAIITINAAYEWMQQHTATRTILHEKINYFRSKKHEYTNATWLESITPIQSLVLGSNKLTKDLAAHLKQQALNVSAVMHPTVPEGKERLRICLHAFNSFDEIDQLHQSIQDFLWKRQ